MRMLGLLVTGVFFIMLVLSSNKLQAAEPGERIGNWFYNCGVGNKLERGTCYISQTVESKKGKRAIRLLVTNVGYLFNDSKLWMVAILPLETWNVEVQKETILDVDKKRLLSGKVDVCFTTGCRIGFLIDENSITAFKRGNVAGLSFSNINGKKVRIEISLKGITKALRTLR